MAERIATTASMIFCALCALAGTAKASECGELLPPSNVADNRSGVTPEQLLKLRDIGQAYGGDPRRHPFTFSPANKSIASPSRASFRERVVQHCENSGGAASL